MTYTYKLIMYLRFTPSNIPPHLSFLEEVQQVSLFNFYAYIQSTSTIFTLFIYPPLSTGIQPIHLQTGPVLPSCPSFF
jgi:hypothetical protein